jgi:hypothetical protein
VIVIALVLERGRRLPEVGHDEDRPRRIRRLVARPRVAPAGTDLRQRLLREPEECDMLAPEHETDSLEDLDDVVSERDHVLRQIDEHLRPGCDGPAL